MAGHRLALAVGRWALAALACVALSSCTEATADQQPTATGGACRASASLEHALERAKRDPVSMVERYSKAWSAAGNPNNDLGFGIGLLAGVHSIESSFALGETTGPAIPRFSGDDKHARGPMQFLPSTWRMFGADGNGDGVKDVHQVDDAVFGAARYLTHLYANAKGNWHQAVFGYNHSDAYVRRVLDNARAFAAVCEAGPTAPVCSDQTVPGTKGKLVDGIVIPPAAAPEPVQRMICAGNRIARLPYMWGGGHPARPQIDKRGYDCSGLTMYVLREAGYIREGTNMVADDFAEWGEPATEDDWVRIYTNRSPGRPAPHVYVVIAGVRLDAEQTGRKGPAWRPTGADRRAGFNAPRRPPGLGGGGGATDPRA